MAVYWFIIIIIPGPVFAVRWCSVMELVCCAAGELDILVAVDTAVGSNGDPKLSPMSSAQNIVQKIFCQILAHRSYALSVT